MKFKLYYKLVDGAYLVSGYDPIVRGAMALHEDLNAAVAEIKNEQIPILARLNYGIETDELGEIEIELIERTPEIDAIIHQRI